MSAPDWQVARQVEPRPSRYGRQKGEARDAQVALARTQMGLPEGRYDPAGIEIMSCYGAPAQQPFQAPGLGRTAREYQIMRAQVEQYRDPRSAEWQARQAQDALPTRPTSGPLVRYYAAKEAKLRAEGMWPFRD
jgi:hypothetical protein